MHEEAQGPGHRRGARDSRGGVPSAAGGARPAVGYPGDVRGPGPRDGDDRDGDDRDGDDRDGPALRTQGGVRSRDLDRRLDELSGELRLLMPATTVLVAFLLTVPFQSGWSGSDTTSQVAYFVAFLSALAAVVFFGGVSAYHRFRGYPYDKEGLLRTANRQAIAGIVLLAVALGAAAFLVTRVLFGDAVAVATTASLAVLAAGTWVVLPLSRRGGRRARKR